MRKSVAIVKESRPGEDRVIALPTQARDFRDAGFAVFVEEGAGDGVGVDDKEYETNGATILPNERIWSSTVFVLKYKPPTRKEIALLSPAMTLGAIFHAEGEPELVEALCARNVTAYSYEFFCTEDGAYPLATAGGEVAGTMAVLYGAYHLQRHLGGSGVLIPRITGAYPAKVAVIGYGNVGGASVRLAADMGAEVVVLGTDPDRLEGFRATLDHPSIRTAACSRENLARELPAIDLVIGAIRISTYNTPAILDEDLVRLMKPGSIIVDVTCGYGRGYLPTFDHPTTFKQPTYRKHGVLHCKLDALPAAFPVTTTEAYSAKAGRYLIALGNSVFGETDDPISRAGKIIEKGRVVHPVVEQHMDYYKTLGNANV